MEKIKKLDMFLFFNKFFDSACLLFTQKQNILLVSIYGPPKTTFRVFSKRILHILLSLYWLSITRLYSFINHSFIYSIIVFEWGNNYNWFLLNHMKFYINYFDLHPEHNWPWKPKFNYTSSSNRNDMEGYHGSCVFIKYII